MKVDIYKSKEVSGRYFVIKPDTDLSILPETVESAPVKTIDMNKEQEQIGLATTEAIKDIKAKGYHATTTLIQIKIGTA